MIPFLQVKVAMFEARCREKIQQFEDAGSDEEDIWDEKDVAFVPEAQRRTRLENYTWILTRAQLLQFIFHFVLIKPQHMHARTCTLTTY